MRHDLGYPKVLDWLISTVRWITACLPKKVVENGTITKARQYLGVDVFRLIFEKFKNKHYELTADFQGRSTVIFDGVTGTTPDTPSNTVAFGKPSTKKGSAAFPQIRAVALMSLTLRCIIEVAFGPYIGKGTGERALMLQIINKFEEKSLLFLFDAGFYAFELLELFKETHQEFIMKFNKNSKVKCVKKLSDDSYIGLIKKKFKNPDSVKGISEPQIVKEIEVRVIPYQLKGFRAARLITNIFDETITATEIVNHYHKRWDIELAFDEIKNCQCATLKGQLATVFRSKTAELVKQELYAILITYNCIRQLMCQASEIHNKNPRFLSFSEVLQLLITAIPIISVTQPSLSHTSINYLLYLISESGIDRPRRPRVNPRVVKVNSSKFKRKNAGSKGEQRSFKNDIQIIQTG